MKKALQKSTTITYLPNNLPTNNIDYKKVIEFIYKEDGVYIKINENITIDDIKTKIEVKKISQVDLDAVYDAIQKKQFENEIKIAGIQEEIKIDSKCEVKISSDILEVSVYITPPLGGKDITEEAIYAVLKENDITFGIKDEEIKKIVVNKLYDRDVKIAEGIASIEGESAKLEYHFDTSTETVLLENEGGKIDFRELSLIKNVTAGQVLVTMTPATEGVPGKNIKGEDIKPREGKKVIMPKGKNVVISDDGLQIVSSIAGEVKIIDNKVHVFALYMVPAN
ncbi:MAG: hypothetical protein K0Q99_441, partial [Clostridia bacterium]|nr:hypothetical protein [Clostridia bacterium]